MKKIRTVFPAETPFKEVSGRIKYLLDSYNSNSTKVTTTDVKETLYRCTLRSGDSCLYWCKPKTYANKGLSIFLFLLLNMISHQPAQAIIFRMARWRIFITILRAGSTLKLAAGKGAFCFATILRLSYYHLATIIFPVRLILLPLRLILLHDRLILFPVSLKFNRKAYVGFK